MTNNNIDKNRLEQEIKHKYEEYKNCIGNYKICNEQISNGCLKVGNPENFKRSVCLPCYNTKCLIKRREKEGKVILIENNLSIPQIVELFNSLTSHQLLKFTGILTPEQELIISKNQNNKLNSLNNSYNNYSNDFKENSNNNSPETSRNNSPQLQSIQKKPILKLISSH